jgi:cell division protein FtsL
MLKKTLAVLCTLAIPVLLFATVWQSSRYVFLESDAKALEKQQYDVISLNKRMISGITVLSTPERIEKIATTELRMRKAEPGEILRIELKKGALGG